MRAAAWLGALCFLVGAPAWAADIPLSNLTDIPVKDGVTTVDQFSPDGRPATIVRGWRDNGNAHGYYIYMVMMPSKPGDDILHEPGVVTFDTNDTRSALPFNGKHMLSTMRFAKGTVSGQPSTLAIYATLGDSVSLIPGDHAPVQIDIYQLKNTGVEVGSTPDSFHLITTIKPQGAYCNADAALMNVLHLALPADYEGAKTTDGC